MKRFFGLLLVFAICAYSQPAQTGYLIPSTGAKTLSSDMALNSLTGVHSCKKADSVGLLPAVKWGSHYVLKCIYNNSNVNQIYLIVDSTAQGLDTFPLNLPAYTISFPLPYVKKIISGAVIDSTLYIMQYK
jgi:hypothetical protein